MICKNCESQLTGNFCYECGQKSRVAKINFQYLVNEIPNSIFQLNRGFFYTFKELLIRPGHTIREYLEGKRVKHYKPISYLLITSALYVLSGYLTGEHTFFYDAYLGFLEGAGDEHKSEMEKNLFIDGVANYQAYIPLIMLPLFAFSTYLAFIRFKYNYFEHLIINFYITGQQMILYLVLGSFFYMDGIIVITPLIIGFIYNFWTFNQIFEQKRLLPKLGMIVLSYLIFIIGSVLITSLFAAIIKI